MPARFLLGPAGSGKTFRCLAEIRAELKANPDGAPLIFLAPKQATFQIERQLLETEAGPEAIAGFSRLHIFSFDKLADFIFAQLNLAPPRLLAGEGRIMVLRALLMRHEGELKLFGRSARRPGFAQELSALLAELQQHQFSPAKLRALAGNRELRPELQNKLLDLARLLAAYTDWLKTHQLQDADCLLALATEALKDQTLNGRLAALRFWGLWLDGFAEMTPQELDLLAAIVPFCQQATLAFCLEGGLPGGETEGDERFHGSRLSIWSAIRRTFQRCRARLAHLPGSKLEVEILPRHPKKNRFAGNQVLQFVETNWQATTPGPVQKSLAGPAEGLSLCACADPEAEAVQAARTILKFVRDEVHPGNRFRDCAVLVRHLDQYHKPIARVFRRYGIPFFLDRRESVAHHPLAELTRGACRTIAFDWQHDDWFATLKAGFSPVPEADLDRLENTALEFGWRGKKWREPLEETFREKSEFFADILARVIPPFEAFFTQLARTNFQPSGTELAGAIRELWNQMQVPETLEAWTEAETQNAERTTQPASPHQTVFEQMNRWLDNLTLAFPDESLPLRDWLPVLEAGLAGLTVGVVPPVLDEVLVGAIDRARNPELKLMLLLGVNESVFPAAPAAPAILTQVDRDELEMQNAALGPDLFDQISRERFLGYIACTRSREQLGLTYSRQGADGSTLNPSPFIAHLQKLVPRLVTEEFSGEVDWREAERPIELVRPLVAAQAGTNAADRPDWTDLPALKPLADKLAGLREPDENERLSPASAEKIYGPVLKSSVSRLEEFAACAFRFFVRSGLRANERKVFELDARERGNFQHDVLKLFQEQLEAENKRWRDLTVPEARDRIAAAAAERRQDFRDGLLHDSPQTRFAAQMMAAALQDFVETIVTWMHRQYEFDPAAAELDFGGEQARIPAWTLDLGAGHTLALQGRIDRVDLWRADGGDQALAVVMDYKSSGKKLEPVLVENGVQLQLLAYLGALRHWKNPREMFGVDRLVPVGAFYINLRGDFKSGSSRDDVLGDAGANRVAYRHGGRFDTSALGRLDSQKNADQFTYRLAKDGSVYANSAEALPRAEFEALLDRVEEQLRTLGTRIFAGEARVDPYRKGSQTPCEYCDYRPICRIDEWTHTWRVLRAGANEFSKNVGPV